jgi:hypothetical protein
MEKDSARTCSRRSARASLSSASPRTNTGLPFALPVEADKRTIAITRGKSRLPLFVTSAGIEVAVAASHMQHMPGAHRLPTLLKAVDALVRASR